MKILSAKILLTNGPDRVSLVTDMPCPYLQSYLPSQPALELDFDTSYDTGATYVRDHFSIEPEIINVR